MKKKPTQKGGKRLGAGRKPPPIPLASHFSIRLEVDLFDELRATATTEGMSLSRLINLRLRSALESLAPQAAPSVSIPSRPSPLPPAPSLPKPLYPITPDRSRMDEHPAFDPDRVGHGSDDWGAASSFCASDED